MLSLNKYQTNGTAGENTQGDDEVLGNSTRGKATENKRGRPTKCTAAQQCQYSGIKGVKKTYLGDTEFALGGVWALDARPRSPAFQKEQAQLLRRPCWPDMHHGSAFLHSSAGSERNGPENTERARGRHHDKGAPGGR